MRKRNGGGISKEDPPIHLIMDRKRATSLKPESEIKSDKHFKHVCEDRFHADCKSIKP